MKNVSFDNELGHRGRHHRNLLAIDGETPIIIVFDGSSVPGVARVLSENYKKNGKWSHTTWNLELSDGVEALSFSEDWGTGKYFIQNTWNGVIEHLLSEFGKKVTPEWRIAVERFIRAEFPNTTKRLDEESTTANKIDRNSMLKELVDAQEAEAAASKAASDLKKEIGEKIEAIELVTRAQELQKKVSGVKDTMKKKPLSLDELKELYNSL